MNITRFLAWATLVVGLAALVPAPATAQVGRFIKKKMKERVEQTVAGADSASADPAASAAVPASGPLFNEWVLEITPDVLDRLEQALGAEVGAREENARRVGKVLAEDEYDRCRQDAVMTAEGQKLTEESVQLIEAAKTDEEIQQAMVEMGERLEAFMEPRCGLEPKKAERLQGELAPRITAAAEKASGLNDHQLSILKERILPFCLLEGDPADGEVRIPTEDDKVFWVYSRGEVEALRPRCGRLVEALQAEG